MYKAVFWVNIVRTRDIVLLPIEPLPEVSHRVWFLFMCHVKGSRKLAFFAQFHVFRLVFALFAGRMEKENFGSLVEPKRTYGRIVSVKGSGGGKTDGLL